VKHFALLSCSSNCIASLEPLAALSLTTLASGNNPYTDIGELVNCPPRDFNFDSPSIPTQELERILAIWSNDSRHATLARQVSILLGVRRRDVPALRALARVFEGRRYLDVQGFYLWEEARDLAAALGGHLVTIANDRQQEFLKGLFPQGCWFWMGLNTQDGRHTWVTGEPFVFSAFSNPDQERKNGPRVFSGQWVSEDGTGMRNSFLMQWDD
jgi:hypothetical protein